LEEGRALKEYRKRVSHKSAIGDTSRTQLLEGEGRSVLEEFMARRWLGVGLGLLNLLIGVNEPGVSSGFKDQHPEGDQRGYSIKVNVNTVLLNVSVQDRRTNRSIAGLKKEDFLVYEDGVLQQIDRFQPSDESLNVLLLLDVSGSTGLFLQLMKAASIDFVRSIKSNDRVAIATFSSRVDLVQKFSSDRARVEQAIRQIWAGGGTSFYDALMTCITEYIAGVDGRTAIVLFTDGIDNQLDGGYPAGSQTTFDELYRGIQETEPMIYPIFLDTIGLGSVANGGTAKKRAPTLERIDSNPSSGNAQGEFAAYELAMRQLQMIADQTGGRMYSPRKIEELAGIYSEIAGDLRIQYLLGYNPADGVRDDRWREIKVKIKSLPEAVVRTRKGYYAHKIPPHP
jgi:VWFA-related protein